MNEEKNFIPKFSSEKWDQKTLHFDNHKKEDVDRIVKKLNKQMKKAELEQSS